MTRQERTLLQALVATLCLTMLPVNSSALGCKFDSIFMGQVKRGLLARGADKAVPLDPRITSITFTPESNLPSPGTSTTSLHGYMISTAPGKRLEGYLLVFTGNSQPARTIVEKLIPLADLNYDILAFDYRGLLTGTAPPSVGALIDDARQIVRHLNTQARYTGTRQIVYALSSGGVVALQALSDLKAGDALILDAVPDKLPAILWCDTEVHPQNSIRSRDLSSLHILVLHGRNDTKVRPLNSRSLLSVVEHSGGCHRVLPNGTHPFEDDDDPRSRIDEIASFLRHSGCRQDRR